MKSRHFSQPSQRRQKGIATILIVVLVGVALTATAMGVMHSMRSTQEKHVAVHALTHAQTGLWTGVEALRLYLDSLTSAQLLAMNGSASLPLEVGAGNAYGTMSIKNVTVEDKTNSYRVNATVVNSHGAANASAAVGVVYDIVKNDPCPGCVTLSTALDFHDDLVVSGQITFTLPAGAKKNINVDGNVSMLNMSTTSLGILNSTGSVSLGSSLSVEEINSNSNVILVGGAIADKVTTRGMVATGDTASTTSTCQSGTPLAVSNFICHLNPNTAAPNTCTHVCLGGSSGARVVWANGAVALGGSTRSDSVNSRSTITVRPTTNVTHGALKAKEDVFIHSRTVEDIQTKGAVSILGTPQVNNIIAEGNLKCNPATWNNYTSIKLNGVVDAACEGPLAVSNLSPATKILKNQSNSVTVMNEVQPFTTPKTVVDVWTLKQHANYIFEYDSAQQRTKVTVNNISGVSNGSQFWLGNYAGRPSHLCSNATGTGADVVCTSQPTIGMCIGWSSNESCLSYLNGTWKFVGKSMVPGILWFKGNLDLHNANGPNNSTILATGKVTLSQGQIVINSVNYAGFNTLCKALGVNNEYQNMYSDQYPTNLCDMAGQKLKPLNVGNIGIAAGGYDPAGNGAYSGGDISLGQNNTIAGSVLAGGYLTTDGQTSVYGYVTAAVLGAKLGSGVKKNDLRGNTTIDLTRSNDNYNPAQVPDMTGGACPNCQGLTGPQPGEVKLLWSRYL